MFKDKKFIQQAITSLLVVILPAMLFIGSYHYEESFLVGAGVSSEVAREVTEVDLRTYTSFASSLISVLVIIATFTIIILKTRLRNLFKKSQLSILILVIVILVTLLLTHWAYPKSNISETHPLFLGTAAISEVTTIVIIFLTVYENVDLRAFNKIKIENTESYILLGVILVFSIYWLNYGFSYTISNLAYFKQNIEMPLESIEINKTQYRVVRTYNDKILLFENGDEQRPRHLLVKQPESNEILKYSNY